MVKKDSHIAERAFTLIELLVVIAIIGLLGSIILVSLKQARSTSRDALRAGNLRQIRTGLELYYSDNNFYPASFNIPFPGSSTGLWACWDCVSATVKDKDMLNPYTGAVVAPDIKTALQPYIKQEIKDVYKIAAQAGQEWVEDERGYWYISDGKDFKVGSYVNPENMTYYNGLMVDTRWCTPDPSNPSGCQYGYTGVGFWSEGAANW